MTNRYCCIVGMVFTKSIWKVITAVAVSLKKNLVWLNSAWEKGLVVMKSSLADRFTINIPWILLAFLLSACKRYFIWTLITGYQAVLNVYLQRELFAHTWSLVKVTHGINIIIVFLIILIIIFKVSFMLSLRSESSLFVYSGVVTRVALATTRGRACIVHSA